MKSFSAAFQQKTLPIHYLLGLDERVTPLEHVKIDGHGFFSACAASKPDIVVTFLLSGFDINATDIDAATAPDVRGFTGLHYAARAGDYLLIQLLLNEGAAVDAPAAGSGLTPLMLALSGGFVDAIRILLAHGASPTQLDSKGDPAIFYAVRHPIALHVCKTMLNLDLPLLRNEQNQTLLHSAARQKATRYSVLYLCEMGGLDVNAVDANDETALHVAARVNDIDVIKALLAKGADPNRVARGKTPITMRESAHGAFMLKCVRQNNTILERMTQPDASNLANIDAAQGKHFAVAFIVPNVLLWVGSLLPTFIGIFFTFASAVGFTLVAKFALSQKNRSLATAGWFSGALAFGSYVLVTRIFPIFAEDHPWGDEIIMAWWIVTIIMFINYARSVLADPGAVHSSAESRREIIETVARDGETSAQQNHFDVSTYVKKPLRSKHCSKTHFTVYRFDHYCVWTGNAIAGGNHRAFVVYCCFQTLSQILVSFSTLSTLFWYMPARSKVELGSIMRYVNWMFSTNDTTLITVFLVLYNSFVFLFVSTVVLTQLWYASRNVTSNEVWFADRYEWMFTLGSRAYSLYDNGPLKNLIEFFWTGNLCAAHYTIPRMNEYLTAKTRQYAARVKSRQASAAAGCSSVPTAITSAEQDTTSTALSPLTVGSPQTPSEALTELQSLLPDNKRQEMVITQAMLEQMIAGATEPVPPASIVDEHERSELIRKVKVMYRHLQQASGGALSGS